MPTKKKTVVKKTKFVVVNAYGDVNQFEAASAAEAASAYAEENAVVCTEKVTVYACGPGQRFEAVPTYSVKPIK